jgi:hypothetical protein
MKSLRYSLIIAVLFIACNSDVKKQVVKSYSPIVKTDTAFINNDLSNRILGRNVYKADTNKIKKLFAPPVNLQIVEKEGETEPYSFYTFTNKTNKLTLFYKSSEGFYIENGEINDKDVVLNKKVFIGMGKDAFLHLLNTDSLKVDTIRVDNEELTLRSTFIFKNDRLIQIKLAQTIENLQ